LVGLPPNAEDNAEIRYKYFSLEDGKLKLTQPSVKEPHYYYNVCFDHYNNVVWGINDNKKTFDILACYRNITIPEKFQFNEDS